MALLWWAWVVTCAWATLPLAEVTVRAEVSGPVAEVSLHQTFRNTSREVIEAVYVFPLHEGAAVDHMAMEVGGRRIVGRIEERRQAEITYTEAKAAGHTAALTTQQRANLFTQRVGNIGPGETVRVELRLVQPVTTGRGGGELVLPLLAAPRFVAPGQEGARGPRWVTAEGAPLEASTEVVVRGLPEGSKVGSTTHELDSYDLDGVYVVRGPAAMDRDLVVRWTSPAAEPDVRLFVQGEHVLLTLDAPAEPPPAMRVPREWIWVVDTSCSMRGEPMDLARDAMLAMLDRADPRDRWQLLSFSDEVEGPRASQKLTWSQRTHERGRIWNLQAQGGTYLLDGVLAALRSPRAWHEERVVVFVTDGLVGDESPVLRAIAEELGSARLYAIGVGPAPHRWLLEEMAALGGGHTEWVRRGESPEAAVDRFVAGLDAPLLSRVKVDWGDWAVDEVLPQRMPVLHAGRAAWAVGRLRRRGQGPVRVEGVLGDRGWSAVAEPTTLPEGRRLEVTWARSHIGALERTQAVWGDTPALGAAVLRLSLQHRVLSSYTAFVAVDEGRVVDVPEGSPPKTEEATVAAPSGTSWTEDDDFYYDEGVEEIVVVAAAAAVDTESTTRGTVLTKEYLNRIPAGRSYQQAVQMAPGVSGNPNLGGAANENTYLMDGANITDPVTGTFSANFNYDVIQQLEVVDGGVMPETPGAALRLVQIETRSGSNHVDLSLRADHVARVAPEQAPLGAQHLSGLVSGPVVRDKAWVLGSVSGDLSTLDQRRFEGRTGFVKATVQPTVEWRATTQVAVDQAEVTGPDPLSQRSVLPAARLQWFPSPEVVVDGRVSRSDLRFGGDERSRSEAGATLTLYSVDDPLRGHHDLKAGVSSSRVRWTLGEAWAEEWLGVPLAGTEQAQQLSLFAQDSVRYGRVTLAGGLRTEVALGRVHQGPRGYLMWDPWGDQRTQLLVGAGRRFGLLGLAPVVVGPEEGLTRVDELMARVRRELVRDLAFEVSGVRRQHVGVPAFGGERVDLLAGFVEGGLEKIFSRRWYATVSVRRSWAEAPGVALLDDGSLLGFAWSGEAAAWWSLPTDPWTQRVGVVGSWRDEPLGTLVPAVGTAAVPELPRWMLSVELSQDIDVRKGAFTVEASGSWWSVRPDERDVSPGVGAQTVLPLVAAGGGPRFDVGVAYAF